MLMIRQKIGRQKEKEKREVLYLEVGIEANALQERRRQRPPNAAPTTLELARAKRRVTLHEHADAGETVQRRHPPSRYCGLPLIFGRPAVSVRKEDQN